MLIIDYCMPQDKNQKLKTVIQCGRAVERAGILEELQIESGMDLKINDEEKYFLLVGYLNHCLNCVKPAHHYWQQWQEGGQKIVEQDRIKRNQNQLDLFKNWADIGQKSAA